MSSWDVIISLLIDKWLQAKALLILYYSRNRSFCPIYFKFHIEKSFLPIRNVRYPYMRQAPSEYSELVLSCLEDSVRGNNATNQRC